MSVFAVLVICRGNQCRSPIAEHDLRRRLSGSPTTVEVMSAGTDARDGAPVHPRTAQALTAAGLAVPEHRSAPLVAGMVEAADLVLTMESGQRTLVGTLDPAAAARTFTLLEFAHLGSKIAARGRTPDPWTLVQQTAAARPVAPGTRIELPDPIAGDVELHASVLAQVIRADAVVAGLLSGS